MSPQRSPLLSEWACLGAVYDTRTHGFAVSKRLATDGDLGRVWHVSRPLTYRALDQLRSWGWIETCGEESGSAGPSRTLLIATRLGQGRLRSWLMTPVEHVRDVRNELLLKVVLARDIGHDIATMLDRQCELLDAHAAALTPSPLGRTAQRDADVIVAWRREMTLATQRFVRDLARSYEPGRGSHVSR